MNRPWQPPPPPDAPPIGRPVAPRSPRTVGERLRALGAFSSAVLLLSGWGALWGFVLPPDLLPCVCLGVPGALCLLVAAGVLALPLLEEAGAMLLDMRAGHQEVVLRWQAGQAAIDAVAAHTVHVYGPPAPAERVILHNPWQQVGRSAAVPPPKARGPATDRPTQHLPGLPAGVPPVPYAGTATEALIVALAAGAPCSVRQRPAGCSRPDFERAVAVLRAAGVVAQARGRPPTLTAPFARLVNTPHYLHHHVQAALGAGEE